MRTQQPARIRIAILALGAIGATVALAAAPPDQYEISTTGVQDRRTGLYWQRTPDGVQRSFADAQAYCESLNANSQTSPAWRLPYINELETLVDVRASNPAIDSNAFPSTKSTPYWTQSPYVAPPSGSTWALNFATGVANGYVTQGGVLDVRCVQPVGVE